MGGDITLKETPSSPSNTSLDGAYAETLPPGRTHGLTLPRLWPLSLLGRIPDQGLPLSLGSLSLLGGHSLSGPPW